ncbi:RNA pseudouridine synthase 4, mitochondrial isoform X3 [Pyrus x bretschneideri]|uniref:RNA pseudouridine synthase 4, mitochondrial isoform X3 n=1 Tax=Pyrus x bretschneideri TaxID=225117 RepID=UPI00202F913B|nr:RNA pseudouridine synthase 4, mitochondrial isoform X3 [Pyrus x bretschneideri]
MVGPILLRRLLLSRPPPSSAEFGSARICFSAFYNCRSYAATSETIDEEKEKGGQKWFTLPSFTATVNGAAVGKELSRNRSNGGRGTITNTASAAADTTTTTALKWVTRCCPELPRSLVQKLFRLRQVRRESCSGQAVEAHERPLKRVHRLDRDSSGLLVMGRTQTIAAVLHSIFREKTVGASNDVTDDAKRILQRRYWALVIGSPRQRKGLISAPLVKVVVDNGKSERITAANDSQTLSSQHAITKYKVIGSSCPGFTWLELTPLTGRKHQLRVHCAEVLRTPIVGDYKYGWQTHRNWKPLSSSNTESHWNEELRSRRNLPFDLNMDSGSISEKTPRLHLHCKQMVLPNVYLALQNVKLHSDCDLSELESLELVAPLPSYMQRSWDITNS